MPKINFIGFARSGQFITREEKQRNFYLLGMEGKDLKEEFEPIKKSRTSQQNKALHKYFALLAEALNESGLDMRKTLKQDVEIPWTMENIKNYLWRPIQKELLKKKSTRDLDTGEITKVYDVLNRMTGEKFGISLLFPSIENLMNEDLK